MAKMGIASLAMNLGSPHEQASVRSFANWCPVDWREKAGPACAAVEFGGLVKQGFAAAHAMKHTTFFWKVVMGEGALCSMFSCDLIGQWA